MQRGDKEVLSDDICHAWVTTAGTGAAAAPRTSYLVASLGVQLVVVSFRAQRLDAAGLPMPAMNR